MASSPVNDLLPPTAAFDDLQDKDIQFVLRAWEGSHEELEFDPVPVVARLAEIFEDEIEIYHQRDLDPFDERHPSRIDPDCELGRKLKLLFRKDNFMTKLVNDYMRDNYFTRQRIQKSSLELNVVSCRLILIIMPGLELSSIFQVENESLMHRLYSWATDSPEPLQSFATGLLAAAMAVQDIVITFREQNAKLVPLMLSRLRVLENKPNHFMLKTETIQTLAGEGTSSAPEICSNVNAQEKTNVSDPLTQIRLSFRDPNLATGKILIMRYLTPMGEYQEFLGLVFQFNIMEVIFRYIDNMAARDMCIAFESLKYLAALLCHKKFCLEFIGNGGLEHLMLVLRPSIAATGVSYCLYCLSYCEDAMEQICSLPKSVISELVTYALWLLDSSHYSARFHATMFFGLSFQFKVILDEFDEQDGLRKLYSLISGLTIFSIEDETVLSDDEQSTVCQIVRQVCFALKKYFESHLYFKYTRATHQNGNAALLRASVCTSELVSKQVLSLQELSTLDSSWTPVDELIRLGGISLLTRIIVWANYNEWYNNYKLNPEIIVSILETITVCCANPKVHHLLCMNTIEHSSYENQTSVIQVILSEAESKHTPNVHIQKAALAVLIQCVCSPIYRSTGAPSRFWALAQNETANSTSNDFVKLVWECVRSCNGIIILLQLMQIRNPITDADCIRGMACRALAGLSRSETVRQILSKLPLFSNGQLQALMKYPILLEKRSEHVTFQMYALELIEGVSGKSKTINSEADTSLALIHRANIVAQTRIQFNEAQLYQLMSEYLISKGLNETAAVLQKETSECTTNSRAQQPDHLHFSCQSMFRQRKRTKQTDQANLASCSFQSKPDSQPSVNDGDSANNNYAIPLKISKKETLICKPNNSRTNATQNFSFQRSMKKPVFSSEAASQISSPKQTGTASTTHVQKVTLETIITEYLTNQHACCKYPMSTCPQFDLLAPHRCPDPRTHKSYPNFASRFNHRQAGFNSRRLDRRLVHSNFSVVRTLRAQDTNIFLTSCSFTACSSNIIAGCYNGDVKVFNVNQSTEEFAINCHDSYISSIKVNREGNLVIVSSSWPLLSTLLTLNIDEQQLLQKFQWEDENYCEFSNKRQDKMLGTRYEIATIYDLNTGQQISQFVPTLNNQYTKNRATFNPTDDLILSDGVLWDVRGGSCIHKFDKLNQAISGAFNPNGLEIVANTEVWDLRTFHLLRSVPILDKCFITFSPQNVMYGISFDEDSNVGVDNLNFKTLDSYDYSSIATTDVKRYIYDLGVNKFGTQIALAENQGNYASYVESSAIRVYNVGQKKLSDDETETEDLAIDEGPVSDTESVVISTDSHERLSNLLTINPEGIDTEIAGSIDGENDLNYNEDDDDEDYEYEDEINDDGDDDDGDDDND